MGKSLDVLHLLDKVEVTQKPGTEHLDMIGAADETELPKSVAAILSKEIDFYTGTLFPVVKSVVETVELEFKRSNTSKPYIPSVDIFTYHKDIIGVTVDSVDVNFDKILMLKLDTSIEYDLSQYVNTLIAGPNGKRFRMYKMSDYNKVFETLFTQKATENTRVRALTYEDTILAYHLLSAIIKGEPLPNIRVSDIEVYNAGLQELLKHVANSVRMITRIATMAESEDRIVIATSTDKSKILISGKLQQIYYNNGGTVEAMFGAALSGKFTYARIIELKHDLEAIWEKHVTNKEIARAPIVKDLMVQTYVNALKSTDFGKHAVSVNIREITNRLSKLDKDSLFDVVSIVEHIMLEHVYCKTNAKMFVKEYKYFKKQGLDVRGATLGAAMRVITEFYLSTVDISTRD